MIDVFERHDAYKEITSRLVNLLKSKNEQPRAVVICVDARHGVLSEEVYRRLLHEFKFKRRYSNGILEDLCLFNRFDDKVKPMYISIKLMKKIPWIFDLRSSFPTFIVLRRDLSIVDKLYLQDEWVSEKDFKRSITRDDVTGEVVLPGDLDLKFSEWEKKLNSSISAVLSEGKISEEKGESSANPRDKQKTGEPEFLAKLREAALEITHDAERRRL